MANVDQQVELNANFYCPITADLMTDPVIDLDGNTFERSAITQWLSMHFNSPITRRPMRASDLLPNRALKQMIEEAVQQHGASMPRRNPNGGVAAVPAQPLVVPSNELQINIQLHEQPSLDEEFVEVIAVVDVHSPAQELAASYRTPTDLVLVVDTSGSMNQQAKVEGLEQSVLSTLDIVKHAIRTIICTANEFDRLAIISYSDDARIVCDLTCMSEAGKARAKSLSDSMVADGRTNLWDGCLKALQLLDRDRQESGASHSNRNAAIFLLTDGEPNIEPPRGHIPTLQRYIQLHQNRLPAVLSTFGFGYSLDSYLLRQLAVIGGGTYSFIPDSSLVGTTFIHAVSNALVTSATHVELQLQSIEGVTIVADDQLNNPGRPSTFAANLAKISIGFIPNEQLHHVLLRLKVPKAVYEQKTPILSAKVTYQQCNGSAKTVEHSQNTFGTVADSIDLNVQLLRLKLINAIDQAMNFMTINAQSEAQNVVNQFQSEIQSWLTLNASKRQHESYKAISDFLADLTGQVSLALSRADWFQKWGRHYLPSLQRAHELQLCNNFKDPGVQHYGGAAFSALRDVADDIFSNLPAPQPQPQEASLSLIRLSDQPMGFGRPSTPPFRVPRPNFSMRSFNDRGIGCVHGNSLIEMQNGTFKRAADIRMGDMVHSGRIRCVLVTKCATGTASLCTIATPSSTQTALLITPWHPINVNNVWVFPSSLAPPQTIQCDAVYSFLIESIDTSTQFASQLVCDGVSTAALCHQIFNDLVVSHSLWGTRRCVEALSRCRGWSAGRVVFCDDTRWLQRTAKEVIGLNCQVEQTESL